jgi:hypothetical protein
VLGLLALAGCGGDERDAPVLPSRLGAALAARAEHVAADLRAGDNEGARAEAFALRDAVSGAINAGRVPAELEEHLRSPANALVAAIPPPSPPPAQETAGDGAGKAKGKGKGKGKEEGSEEDEGGTTATVTTTEPGDTTTTTEADGD